ncbi:MAG: TolC family protein [Cyclobacteriaceae bacterium]|jgi:outer membrane protein TolC|nr:TolC family protein [Cyclobacteriaceae bacterium]
MKPFLSSAVAITLLLLSTHLFAQEDLAFYIDNAKTNSPLIQDNKNQSEAARLEIDRLKAFYTKAQISVSGNYQFSPIISRDNGQSDFVLNPETAEKYSGYDLAASNGGVYQGFLNYTQPIFNETRFRASAEQALVGAQINENTIQLTAHDLERFITDQYILCLQDYKQAQYLNDLIRIINDQKSMVSKLVEGGIAKQSDLSLLTIEQKIQQAALNSFQSIYRRDLMDLRVLCGISDTTYQVLGNIDLQLVEDVTISKFTERYRLDSLNLVATQKVFEQKYKPLVGLYANTGLNAVYAPTILNRFGFSAGINFSMTLTDGKQRNITQQRTSVLMKSTQAYKNFFYTQNGVRKNRVLTELKAVTERLVLLEDQLKEYQKLLEFYKQELSRGQISVINYVTTLKSVMTTQRDFVLLQSNKQSLINLYNYWNW